MSENRQKIIMAAFSVVFAVLLVVFFIQMGAINQCFAVHDAQQKVIERQNALIDTLMIRNDALWDKATKLNDACFEKIKELYNK